MKKYTAIIRVKTDLPSVVQECLDIFGEGARLDYTCEEEAFSLCGTPVKFGYCRQIVAEHIAMALQYMLDTGITSEHVEIIRVEFLGQDRVVTGTDEEGNPIFEEQLFQVGEAVDEEGNSHQVYLGRMRC